MSKLISYGDSFTWGTDMNDTVRADLEHYNGGCNYTDMFSRNTWHALLAKQYGFEYKCYAQEGCSNQSIVRAFFEHAHEIEPDDLVNVNFTWRDRYDFLDPETFEWETVRPGCTKDDSKYAEMYYKHQHSHYWDSIESLKAINLITSYLELINVKYIITCIDEMIYYDEVHRLPIITALRDQFKDKITWFNGVGFHQWSKDNNYPISALWHPLEEAHCGAFKYMREIEKW